MADRNIKRVFKLLSVRLEKILVLSLNGFSSLSVERGLGLGYRAEPYSINGPGPVSLTFRARPKRSEPRAAGK